MSIRICVLTTTQGRVAQLERLLESLAAQDCPGSVPVCRDTSSFLYVSAAAGARSRLASEMLRISSRHLCRAPVAGGSPSSSDDTLKHSLGDYPNFSLLIGVQTPSAELDRLLARYAEQFPIVTRTLARCGLSAARNQLLPLAQGDFIALADDDSYYAPDAFARLADYARLLPGAGAFVGRGLSAPVAREAALIPPRALSRYSVYDRAPSWCLFVRSAAAAHVGRFDEGLGIGAPSPWQSGEETDFLVRVLAAGYSVYRAPSIHALHDAPSLRHCNLSRIRGYAAGRMYVLHKHRFPLWFRWVNILHPIPRMLRACLRPGSGAARERFATFAGRLAGLFAVRRQCGGNG